MKNAEWGFVVCLLLLGTALRVIGITYGMPDKERQFLVEVRGQRPGNKTHATSQSAYVFCLYAAACDAVTHASAEASGNQQDKQ